jgi:hypothetical protein
MISSPAMEQSGGAGEREREREGFWLKEREGVFFS